jgi:hypothetical protein
MPTIRFVAVIAIRFVAVVAIRFVAVIASEAKQNPPCIGATYPGDCFASLAMTVLAL